VADTHQILAVLTRTVQQAAAIPVTVAALVVSLTLGALAAAQVAIQAAAATTVNIQ
jgi:hypothetical protein